MKSKKNLTRYFFNRLVHTAAIVICAAISAQSESLPLRNYTTANGLGHDRVEKIVRDSRGFLWFCTGEGLTRFDGYEFKNFTQADGLPHRRITDMIETRDGKYLVATYAGVAVFDPLGVPRRWNDVESRAETAPDSNERLMFRVFRPMDTKQDKRSWTVMDLLESRDGRIWAATLDGFYRVETLGDDFEFHRVEAELWRGKTLEFLQSFEDRFGGLWIATSEGVFRQPPNGEIEKLEQLQGGQAILEDRQGRIWLGGGAGTKGLYVAVFPEGQDRPVVERIYTKSDGLTSNDWIGSLLETSDGRVLIGIANAVCEFLPEAKEGEKEFRVFLEKEVVSLSEDRGGNLWVGTNAHGAFKMTRGGFTLFDEKDFPKPTPFAFNAIFAGEGSDVFLAEHSWDLIRFDGKTFTAVKPRGMTFRSWGWNQIDFRSRLNGEWWIGSHDKVLRYPSVSFEDLAHTAPIGVYTVSPPGLDVKNVFFRLFEDSRGDVWMSMVRTSVHDTSGLGLARWERATDKLHTYLPSEEYRFFDNAPTAFAEDRAGNVWIGYYFGGLVRYRGGKFELFEAKDGMVSGIVNAIYNDSDGRIWIATGGNGIVRVDNPTDEIPSLVNITVSDGLSSNQAACLTEDNLGRVYVGTGRGVTRIEPGSGRMKIYSQADGLPHSYVRTCGRDGAGALWFTQHKMVARLVPEAERPTIAPPVFIGSVRVNGEHARKISELGETVVENLEFTSDQRQVQIDFLALGFGTGETLRYQYKLDDSGWSALSAQRTVNFDLAPGSYNFEVRAVNSDGAASDHYAKVAFTIARPVWQRWWFLALVALIVSSAIYALYRYRLKKAEEVQRALEALSQSRKERLAELDRVRARIATDLHDDIGSSLSQIAVLSEFAQNGNGTSAEPLQQISTVSNELVEAMSDIVWAINPKKDSLHDLLQRMRRFASDVFTTRDIKLEFHAPEFGENVQIGANIRREVFVIFKESVNNIARHSVASKATIKLEIAGELLRLEISDNGRGFDQDKFLHDSFIPSLGGNGLMNMQSRARELGGRCEIDSTPGAGTQITLELPLAVQASETDSSPVTHVGSESVPDER